MEKFTLINKDRSRIKVFEPFEDVSKPCPSIDAMLVSYGCVYKKSSKPVMKGRYLVDDIVKIMLNLNSGESKGTAWGCDLSKKYVEINSEYTT